MNNFKCLILLIMMSLATCSLMAQAEVKVTDDNGNTTSVIVSEQGKVYFSSDTMFVNDGNGQTRAFAISGIRSVNFNAHLTDIADYEQITNLKVYPNPAGDYFCIQSADQNPMQVRLYDMSGRLLKQQQTQNGERVSISDLPAGLYVVQVNNTTFKLSKQ